MQDHRFYGWKLLAVFWAALSINLAFPAYGSSVINAYMAKDLQLDRTMAGLPYSVFIVMSGLPGPLVALLVGRLGVRFTMTIGSLLVMTGALAMAFFVNSGIGAVIAFGVVIGMGVAAGGPLGAQPGVVQWFVRRRALALSLVYSAGGIGGFVAAPLLNRVISSSGGNWRVGWMLVAALAAISAAIAALGIKERPSDLGQFPDGDSPDGASARGPQRPAAKFITTEIWTYREVLRNPSFWLMVLALCGGSAGITLFLAHGVLHLQDLGHSAAAAAWSISILTAATLLGKLALAVLGDRIDPRYVWALTLAVFGVGLATVVNATSTASLYVFAICIGFGFGGGLVCMMTVLSNYYGVRVFAAIAGIAAAVNTAVSFCAPVIAGRLYDQIGSYAPTFYSLAAWCFAGAVVLLILRPPVRGARDVAHSGSESQVTGR